VPAGDDGGVPYAFLAVTAIGLAAVCLAYRPVRREPFTVISFATGWLVGELAFQNIVWEMVATALFIAFGALDGWAGWVGLVLAVVGWVGLVGLGVAGLRTARSSHAPSARPAASTTGGTAPRRTGSTCTARGWCRPRGPRSWSTSTAGDG
jgi:hypothetical protein